MYRRFGSLLRTALLLSIGLSLAKCGYAQRLTVQGDHLAVDGKGQFLLFVSYFDAMQASAANLQADLTYFAIQGHRVDGIRILPNWWQYRCPAPPIVRSNTLFTNIGTINTDAWRVFKNILDQAAARRLIVDVTFTKETIAVNPSETVAEYSSQIVEIASRLRGGYANVLFDVQNEWSKGTGSMSAADIQSIIAAVKAVDSARIVTGSTTGDPNPNIPDHQGQDAASIGTRLMAAHDGRGSGWDRLSTIVATLAGWRAGLGAVRPIYLQEPMPFSPFAAGCGQEFPNSDATATAHRNAAASAKTAGAAAWTFHTRTTFDLSTQSYVVRSDSAEKAEFESIRAAIDAIDDQHWGVTSQKRFTSNDYDGDLKSDLVVFRPSTTNWYIRESSSSPTSTTPVVHTWGNVFGTTYPNDIPVSGDYDGDGRADPTIFRQSDSVGPQWYILKSSTNFNTLAPDIIQWGLVGDRPVPGDYDGDGQTDLAVFRQVGDLTWWHIRPSKTPAAERTYQWGLSGDIAAPGDYDGDGLIDPAVFRPDVGVWYILLSSTGYDSSQAVSYSWGWPGDIPVAGDYIGDGKAEPAVFRPSDGRFYILGGDASGIGGGQAGDVPVPGDYDGDGKTDLAVFRPYDPGGPDWYILKSSTAFGSYEPIRQWGYYGDMPVVRP